MVCKLSLKLKSFQKMESLLHRHTGPLGWHFMTYIHKGFYKAESEGYDLKCFPLGSRY